MTNHEQRRRSVAACAAALAAAVGVAGTMTASGAVGAPLQRVTIVGDSVADALSLVPAARAIVSRGVDLRLEVAVCRRIVLESCPYAGERPPTALQVIEQLGPALGRTVVMDVGYNDDEAGFADDMTTTLDALAAAGVERVLWVTFRAAQHQYLGMNDTIRRLAAARGVAVVDWNLYSRSHPDWFGEDGLHLHPDGAKALATLVHRTLVATGALAPPVSVVGSRVSDAYVGQPYAARLTASGGRPPYRWSVQGLPAGLSATPTGELRGVAGTPVRSLALEVVATDANGRTGTGELTLRIRP
jgi:hypothetical protein